MTTSGVPSPASTAAAQISTLVGSLAHFAATQPERPAYIDALSTLSYGALHEAARRGAAWLAQQGVGQGDTVALPLDGLPQMARPALEMLYAIAYLGAVALPLHPEVPLEMRIALLERHAAGWLIASGAPPQVAGARTLDPRGFDGGDPRYDSLPAPRGDRPDVPLFYFFTSGTTGEAKVLLPTHGQFHGSVCSSIRSLGMDNGDRVMAPLPWPASVSIRYLFHAHACGGAYVAAPIGETRMELGETLRRFGVTRMAASPWQIRRLLQSPAPLRPLPPLRSLRVTGAFISNEELGAARAALTPHTNVGYGFNEIGAVSLLPPGEMGGPGYVGRLLPGVEARVDRASGQALGPHHIGELGFRAAWMCTGYAGNPDATRERFRDGWFYPGDVGSIDPAGNVTLRGRTQEVVNYGGLKIWPEDVESVLKQHPDVLDVALVGLPDPQAGEVPVAFLVPRVPLTGPLGDGLSDAALRDFCRTRIDAWRVPPTFVAVAEIPRNQSGKIMREALVEAYLQARTALVGRQG